MSITTTRDGAIALVTIDHPPVNALPVAGWFALAEAVQAAGADESVHVVVLRAHGRGFCAGVDIKELAASDGTAGHAALIGVNRGCAAAFGAVYDCAVPVVAAVHGFCLGGGIGLVGCADVVIASEDATFGLPEVDRGALGAATHLARLVPQHLLRALYFTARTVDAAELYRHGSVLRVVPRAELDDAALKVAKEVADKDNRVIRAAKEALNGIDPQPVRRSYRFEQGFTYEMTLLGAGNAARARFVGNSADGAS
ncbi:MAG TPA: enoyl-CoA hydratase family protein [Pseudonocardia sp.]|jgi:enoyl-CoA hydratase